jgi:hypothetical protein
MGNLNTTTMKLFPLLIILLSCSNSFRNNNNEVRIKDANYQTTDAIKPIISTIFPDTISPVIFEAAFFHDTKVKQDNLEYSFNILELGKIKIESGKIIACDPIEMNDGVAFTQYFPIGQYNVQLAIAKSSDDERVAFSRIVFSNQEVSKWEFALLPGQKAVSIMDSSAYCYSVDAGTAIFIDELSDRLFCRKGLSEWENVFIKEFEHNNYRGFIYDFDGHSIAIFPTGYGDGCYSTYVGFDNKNKICRLLTDFGLVNWWNL